MRAPSGCRVCDPLVRIFHVCPDAHVRRRHGRGERVSRRVAAAAAVDAVKTQRPPLGQGPRLIFELYKFRKSLRSQRMTAAHHPIGPFWRTRYTTRCTPCGPRLRCARASAMNVVRWLRRVANTVPYGLATQARGASAAHARTRHLLHTRWHTLAHTWSHCHDSHEDAWAQRRPGASRYPAGRGSERSEAPLFIASSL